MTRFYSGRGFSQIASPAFPKPCMASRKLPGKLAKNGRRTYNSRNQTYFESRASAYFPAGFGQKKSHKRKIQRSC